MGTEKRHLLVLICSFFSLVMGSDPPQIELNNIIRTRRGIDLTTAHGLQSETKLDTTVIPRHYEILLTPFIDQGIFTGAAVIDIEILQNTENFTIHCSHDLDARINFVRIFKATNKSLERVHLPASSTMDPSKQIMTVHFNGMIIPATFIIRAVFKFKGEIQTLTNDGLFKIDFKNGTVEESILATQLRPTNARRLFPCFDEPGIKTSFSLSVHAPTDMVVLSNTLQSSSEPTEDAELKGMKIVVFKPTLLMPTYSFGLIMGYLHPTKAEPDVFTDEDGNKIVIRVWGRQGYLKELADVSDKVIRIFREVSSYWKVPLPLEKLDIVALPNYQGVRPADCLGLIVFKESELSTKGYLQLSQEIMYQWIGGLVSPAWWTHAHINKAIVGYLAAETAIRIDNGSEMDGKWPMTVLYSLYYEYSKRYPHSRITGMKQETLSIKIELIFRMLNYTLGEKTFKKGMNEFLQQRKFKSFKGSDVWTALQNAALADGNIPKDVDIEKIANSWISKDRLPRLDVNRNYADKEVKIQQRVFLRERPHDIENATSMMWWIPIVLIRSTKLDFYDYKPIIWLKDNEESRSATISNMPDEDDFIIVNPEEIGPFPVLYDNHNWYLLSKYLESKNRTNIPVLTRAKLLHDAWNLAYAGELHFAVAFNMTRFMRYETDHLVWDPIFTMIDHIDRHIDSADVHRKFEAYVQSLLVPLYVDVLGGTAKNIPENEESWKKPMRIMTKSFLCKVGCEPCILEAREAYKEWMMAENPDEGNPIPNQFICPVFKWGSYEEWEFGLKRVMNFPASRKPSERTFLLKTLAGCPITKDKIVKLLNVSLLEENANFTDNDLFLVLSMLTGGSRGYKILFFFVRDNWNTLKTRFQSKTNLWDSLISSATSMFTTEEGHQLVKQFYVEHADSFGSAEHIIQKSLQNIAEEATWTKHNLPAIDKWLTDYLAEIGFTNN